MTLFQAAECRAQGGSSLEWGGYVKSLLIATKPAMEESFADYLLHLRLNTAWHPLDELTATMELRVRAYAGGSVKRTPGFVEGLQNPAHAWDLDGVLWSGGRTVGFGEIDRLALTWSPPGASIAVGRQRIAWGTNLVWNPIDIFNPLSVLDFDYEERPAVDAVRVQWYTGAVSKLEGAVKAGRSSDDVIAAGMWSFTLREFDVRACAGARGGKPFVGGGWAGGGGGSLGGGLPWGDSGIGTCGETGKVGSLDGAFGGLHISEHSLFSDRVPDEQRRSAVGC